MKLALFALLCLGTLARAESYPPGWENYILLDQLSNIPTRKNETLSAKDSAVVPIYHVDVPLAQAQVTQSKFLDEATRKRVLIRKDGKDYARVFFAEADGIPAEEIKKLGLPVESTHWGTKLQSHSTFLVWEKDRPAPEPFFVKMNQAHWVQNGVLNGDVAESILREKGNSFATLFRENVAIGIRSLQWGNAIREVKPIAMSPTAELAPVHGLLGSESDLTELAKARGLKNAKEWIQQEYLPKLAQFLAQMQYRHGLYLAAHSQNIVLQLNRKTGKIEGFAGRDLVDLIVDPFVAVSHGRPSPLDTFRYPGSVLFKKFVDRSDAKDPGPHLAIFPAQSVTDLTLDPIEKRIFSGIFLDSLRQAAEKELGMNFTLSESAAKAIEALKSGKEPAPHGHSADVPEPEATYVLLGEELYSRVAEARAKQGERKIRSQAAMAGVKATFWEHYYSDKVVFLKPAGWKRLTRFHDGTLEFRYTDAGIYAYEKGNPDPIAFAYDLRPVYRDVILKANASGEGGELDPASSVSLVSPRCRGAYRATK